MNADDKNNSTNLELVGVQQQNHGFIQNQGQKPVPPPNFGNNGFSGGNFNNGGYGQNGGFQGQNQQPNAFGQLYNPQMMQPGGNNGYVPNGGYVGGYQERRSNVNVD